MFDLHIPHDLITLQQAHDAANRAVAAYADAHPDGLTDLERAVFLALARREAAAVRDLHRHPAMARTEDRGAFIAALRTAARVELAA